MVGSDANKIEIRPSRTAKNASPRMEFNNLI